MPDLSFEKKYHEQGFLCVGADEVGRGCLAGPVVAAAVILPRSLFTEDLSESFWKDVNDSKKVKHEKRKILAQEILTSAEVQIAWSFPEEIDEYNILQASMLAMRRALSPFKKKAQVLLVDGNQSPYSPSFTRIQTNYDCNRASNFQQIETIVQGDGISLSIAAASIVAKVYRDEWMQELHETYPQYSFAKHKGYSTSLHLKAIEKHGPCKIHRKSFAPFKHDI